MPLKGIVVIDKEDLWLGEGGVDGIDRFSDFGVDSENHVIHALPELALQPRASPPHAKGVVVALVRVGVEEAGVAGHGDGEPRPLLPSHAVEDFHDDEAETVLELGAGHLLVGSLEGGLAGARVEAVEAKDAAVHDFEEAQVVSADGQKREIGSGGGVEFINLAVLGAGKHVVDGGTGAREELKGWPVAAMDAVQVALHQHRVGVVAMATVIFGAVEEACAYARRVGVSKRNEARWMIAWPAREWRRIRSLEVRRGGWS